MKKPNPTPITLRTCLRWMIVDRRGRLVGFAPRATRREAEQRLRECNLTDWRIARVEIREVAK